MSLLIQKIGEITEKFPSKKAIVFEDTSLTYAQLDEASDKMAHALRQEGITHQDILPIILPRGIPAVVTMLGVWKLGASFAVINNEYPKERVEYICKDVSAKIVIDEAFYGKLNQKGFSQKQNLNDIDENTLAMVVYTSGSTGEPKGVMISHKNVAVAAQTATLGRTDEDVFLALASFTFIAMAFDSLLPLSIGATLHIAPEAFRRDLNYIENYTRNNGITTSFMPPQLAGEYIKHSDGVLKTLLSAGDRARNLYSKSGTSIYNLYGASETAGAIMGFKIDGLYDNTPIGMPFEGVKAYVLDENLKIVKQGNEGEICIAGQVASGYLNKPALTAERFIENPFSEGENDRVIFRTGDLGRVNENGQLVYIQRKDWMVKIRGNRVEVGEIEIVMLRHPQVEKAVVTTFQTAAGHDALFACYITKGNVPVATDDVIAEIAKALPDYMIPSLIEQREALPLNPNGKIDRKNIKPSALETFKAAYIAPTNEMEKAVCAAFAKILGLETVGIDDDFVRLGGDSILAAKLQVELSGMNLTTGEIISERTPRNLSRMKKTVSDIPKAQGRECWPVTFAEKQMATEWCIDPSSCAYNVNLTLEIKGKVDEARLEKALGDLVKRHPILRSYYLVERDGFSHKIADNIQVVLRKVSCSTYELAQKIHELNTPYNLAEAPLFRFVLLKIAEDTSVLLIGAHHIIIDGTSTVFIVDELWKLYRGESLPPVELNYLDYAVWQADNSDNESSKQFFVDMFKDSASEHEMPIKSTRPEYLPPSKDSISIDISAEKIDDKAGRMGITPYELLFSTAALTIAKYCGSDDITLGAIMNGRLHSQTQQMPGMFVNPVPVRIKQNDHMSVDEYLRSVSATLGALKHHQTCPFGELVPLLAPDRDPSRHPMFDVGVNYLVDIPPLEFDGLSVRNIPIVKQALSRDLTFEIIRRDKTLSTVLRYSKELYDDEIVSGILELFLEIIKRVVEDTASTVGDLSEITASQKKQILVDFAGSKSDDHYGTTVVDMFRRQVKQAPDKIAVSFEGKNISYGELDRITDALAVHLSGKGVGRGQKVGILIKRNEMMVISALGVLKSAAAYVPLDPTYPSDRLEYMLEDTGAKIVIAHSELTALIPGYGGEFLIADDIEKLNTTEAVPQGPCPDDLFILLYTSGTTGKPKGVMLTHGNLATFTCFMRKNYDYTSKDAVAAYASFGFDACMMDLYPTLASGACLHILSEQKRLDLYGINDYFHENNVTMSFMTTQVGRQFAANIKNKSLRVMLSGGETLVPFDPPKNFPFYNVYGPTETTVFVTHHKLEGAYTRVPIGRAVANTEIYIMGKDGRLAPVGTAGELCIAGHQVACGYLNKPEETELKFVRNPFSDDPNYSRMYRTGDIARYLPSGEIDFIGRRDFQVKIRGFRIELSEIEGRIRAYPGITDAAVIALDAPGGVKYVAAYIVSDETVDTSDLDRFIEMELPAYMVPTETKQVDFIPLNVNGKVDRKRLTAPTFSKTAISKASTPQTSADADIAEIIKTILGHDQYGPADNLMSAGLSSLSVIKLVVLLEEKFGKAPTVRELIKNPTAAYIKERVTGSSEAFKAEKGPQSAAKSVSRAVSSASAGERDASFDPMETKVANIIEAILGHNNFEKNTNLFSAGFSSLSTIKLVMSVEEQFDVVLPVTDIMSTPTVAFIKELIVKIQSEPRVPRIKRVAREFDPNELYPLSEVQKGIYFECFKRPDTLLYNIPFMVELPQKTDMERFKEAVNKVAGSYCVFKVLLTVHDNEVMQIAANVPADIDIENKTDEELNELRSSFVKPFSLMDEPLYRIRLVKTPSKAYLLTDFHHIVFDGSSMNIFMKAIIAVYEGKPLKEEKISLLEWAAIDAERAGTPSYLEDKAFFDDMLKQYEGSSEITPDIHHGQGDRQLAGKVKTAIAPVDINAAEVFGKEHSVSLSGIFLAALTYTLGRWVYSKELYMSAVSSGRNDIELIDTMGMFVKTVPLALKIEEQFSVLDYVRHCQASLTASVAHESYPLTKIAQDHAFQPGVIFAYQLGLRGGDVLEGQTLNAQGLELKTPKFKLAVNVEKQGNGVVYALTYDDSVYSETLMKGFADTLQTVFERMLSTPDAQLKTISLVSKEQEIILGRFNQTGGDIAENILHVMFEKAAAKTPDKTALIAKEGEYTFEELNRRANAIANSLLSLGVKKDERVALLLERTGHIMTTMLGILKAGCAYIPIDTEYPSDRIMQILQDSQAKFVVVDKARLGDFEKSLDVEVLLKCENRNNPNVDVAPEHSAYIIYTSGSTGKPKGVIIEHRGISNYITPHPINRHISALVQNGNTMVSITTVSFDLFIKESMAVLCNGMKLVFADEDQAMDPSSLTKLMEKHGVDTFSSSPSRVYEYTHYPKFLEALKRCKVIIIGGEPYPKALLEKLQSDEAFGGAANKPLLFNTYGPTEISVSCNGKELTRAERISVGGPLLNVREYVVDTDGNVLPPGVVGELYVGGAGVARGYVNLPEMTSERFITYNNERVYKTGDLARWNADGDIEIIGRNDNQVKLRGLRIELGEIEAVIAKVAGITSCAVLIKKVQETDHLCAYYTVSSPVDVNALKEEISKSLTTYMVPTVYMQIDAMPKTFNGKNDLKALPDAVLPHMLNNEVAAAPETESPETKFERSLCDIFAKILNLSEVGVNDSFFDIGGSSFSATRVIIAAKEQNLCTASGGGLSYGDVFLHKTPRALAKLLSGDEAVPAVTSEIKENYDYSRINELLANNTMETFRKGGPVPLGNILLTGATGFLGVHMLDTIMRDTDSEIQTPVYCMLRKGKYKSADARLKAILFYYFENRYTDLVGSQIIAIDGDLTQKDSLAKLKSFSINTLINCAANVTHFSTGTELFDVNTSGTRNLIDYCLDKKVRLIQISTGSVAGRSVDNDPPIDTKMTETMLYYGQILENQYVFSKFLAEKEVLEASLEGLDAKIMRVGNLMARDLDGEFQINVNANSFVGRLRAYQVIGAFPYSAYLSPVELSPIDSTAQAVLKLARTPAGCRVFHPNNNHVLFMGDIVNTLNAKGIKVEFVEDDVFERRLAEALKDGNKAEKLTSLIAYQNTRGKTATYLKPSNEYTTQVLMRMNWFWPETTKDYLSKFLTGLIGLGYFDGV